MSVLGKAKLVLNALIRRGYWYDNVFMPDIRKFNVYNTFNTRVVNLGSSSSVAAFNYSGLNIKAANWALRRNPLAGDWAVLRNYSSYLNSENSIVIIPLCPFSTLAGGYEPFEDRYYSILYPSTIPSYSYVHDLQAQDKIKNPIKYYPWYGFFMDVWHSISYGGNQSLSNDKMRQNAQNRINGWLHEFSLNDFSTPLTLWHKDNIKEAIRFLNNIIDYCKEINATPVIVVPPVYQTLLQMLTIEARKILFGDVEQLAKEKKILFLNYINDERFSTDRTLFMDSFLMNTKGAKIFTKQVLNDLDLI